ncbi:MAG: metalloproteinase [Muribaculaceae bacterium]|nr:metalloproteinase [Muribaculaceae bacterium]
MNKKFSNSDNLRTDTMTIKASPKEKADIKKNAEACGMTPSEFLRHRGMDYKPTAAITKEEKRLLQNLDGCRSDMVNYANAISGMTPDDRKRMFHQVPSMLRWYKLVYPISDAVKEFIISVMEGGRITPRTRKSIKKLLTDDRKG